MSGEIIRGATIQEGDEIGMKGGRESSKLMLMLDAASFVDDGTSDWERGEG